MPQLLILAVFVIFIIVILRNYGVYTVVSSDESTYSKFSRLLPLEDAAIPGYIYFAVYGITNICGDQFYGCAKTLNAIFFVAAAPFIYVTARRFCNQSISSLVVILTLLSPINEYTSFFMPESLYFFVFWILTWFVLSLNNLSKLGFWGLGGVVLGAAALVKPHALLILPAFVIYILLISKKNDVEWRLKALKRVGVFVISMFVTKLIFGYFLAGNSGVNIFGEFYSSIAGAKRSLNDYFDLIGLSLRNIIGHILAICLMFGLPVAVMIKSAFYYISSKDDVQLNDNIHIYSFLILLNLVFVVGLFTAAVVNSAPSETIWRLHMRYYNFIFPLLFILASTQLSQEPLEKMLKIRAYSAFPVGMAVLFAIYTYMAPYDPNIVDSPELSGFVVNKSIFYLLGGLSFLSLIFWVISAKIGAAIFVYVFMPIFLLFSGFYVNQELMQRRDADVYVRAGVFTKQYLPNEELSKLVIVGQTNELHKTLFHIDYPNVPLIVTPNGSKFKLNQLPPGKDWVLAIGDELLPDDVFFQLPMKGFKLAYVTSTNAFDFKRTVWPGMILSMEGLSKPEAWGAWSSGRVVTFEFLRPLPEKFSVQLQAFAFGPNVGNDFVAQVGENKVSFKLGEFPEERLLEFYNPNNSRTIKITIPLPISPNELGLGDDDRKLGIAFLKLKIL